MDSETPDLDFLISRSSKDRTETDREIVKSEASAMAADPEQDVDLLDLALLLDPKVIKIGPTPSDDSGAGSTDETAAVDRAEGEGNDSGSTFEISPESINLIKELDPGPGSTGQSKDPESQLLERGASADTAEIQFENVYEAAVEPRRRHGPLRHPVGEHARRAERGHAVRRGSDS